MAKRLGSPEIQAPLPAKSLGFIRDQASLSEMRLGLPAVSAENSPKFILAQFRAKSVGCRMKAAQKLKRFMEGALEHRI